MNNFYASVECMLDPSLRKYPVAVCGSVEERHGIVLAKNYAAKAFDVKTGDAVWQAKQKCRNLVVVPPHFEEYIKYSKLARSVYSRYTDQVEPYGMDECWLDVSGTENIFGSPEKVANDIRETIKFELGLTISVGVSFNKIFAKLGSDMKKPHPFRRSNILAYAAEAFVVQGLMVIIDCVENIVTHIVLRCFGQFVGDFISKIAALCDHGIYATARCTKGGILVICRILENRYNAPAGVSDSPEKSAYQL